jgi:hypothetical protein
VWVKQRPGGSYCALNGRLPWQLQRLFKIKLLNEYGTFVESRLTLALPKIPGHSGNLDPVTKFVQVSKAMAAVGFQVFSVGNIVSYTHVMPERATSSTRGDRQNERWIVNSNMHLATSIDVYNEYR